VTKAKKTDEAAVTTPPPSPEGGEQLTVLAPIRTAGLVLAAKLDAAKLRTLKLERARLVARYGADSPEVARVEQQFDYYVGAASDHELDAQRARIPIVLPDPDNLIVHGRVVDANGNGIANASVATNDENGKSLATAKTDSAGYYIMRVAAKGEAQAEVSLTATVGKAKPVAHPAALELAANRVTNVEMMVDA
jgi:hypothetical protein